MAQGLVPMRPAKLSCARSWPFLNYRVSLFKTCGWLRAALTVEVNHLDLYSQVLDHSYASDDLRRMIESKLLRYRQALLFALPSPVVASPPEAVSEKERAQAAEKARRLALAKDEAREETETLAKGMVLLKLPDELAWTIMLDWIDAGSPGDKSTTQFVAQFQFAK
jgi:hypothetical protein